jgi:hypothetical protein
MLAGLGGLGEENWRSPGSFSSMSGDVIDGIGGDSPGTTALEFFMPAVGVPLCLGAAGMIVALLLQPAGGAKTQRLT